MILLGFIQFILILIICIYELNRKSISVFLWATLFIMFGAMHLLSIITNSYNFSKETMNQASCFVILFSIIYIFTKECLDKTIKKEKKIINNDIEKYKEIFMYVLFVLLIVTVLIRIIMLVKGVGSIRATSWETMRDTVKNNNYISISQIFLPIFFVASSTLILALQLKKKRVLIIGILLIVFEVIISRNRIEIMPLIVTFLYNYINKIKKLKLKNIIILGIIGVLSIYIIYGLRVFRRSGTISDFFEKYSFKMFNQQVREYFANDDGELGLRNYFYYFIEKDNNFDNFKKGHTYIRMLMVLVPSKYSLGIKPDDFAIAMGKAVNPKAIGLSIHPTLFGDVYANFGFWGFLTGMFWAIYLKICEVICDSKNPIKAKIYPIIIGSVLVIQARGSVYNAFSVMIYSIIIIQIIYMFFRWGENSVNNRKNKKISE